MVYSKKVKTTERDRQFYPDYLFEIIFVIFIAIEIVLILAMLYPQAIGRQIDFSAQFQPRPEWYFLWLYQLLRYFPGKSAFISAVLIPILATLLLIFIPFIDSGRHGREKATIVGIVLLVSFIIFTLISVFSQ